MPRSVTIASLQLVIPYYRPCKRPLNYIQYKKDSNPNAHLQIFKVVVKANDEMINKEIIHLSNFTLKDNALDWCNNYMRDHPNYKYRKSRMSFL
jgi:hypothetical protein